MNLFFPGNPFRIFLEECLQNWFFLISSGPTPGSLMVVPGYSPKVKSTCGYAPFDPQDRPPFLNVSEGIFSFLVPHGTSTVDAGVKYTN